MIGRAVLVLAGLAGLQLHAAESDAVLSAMRDELNRSREIKVVNLERPYYIAFSLDDGESFSASASLGGLLISGRTRFRIPQIQVRVGDYNFDNTNYVGSGVHYGSRYDIDRFPLDDNYAVLRRYLWLGTDSAYKSAVESISRKRAALKNIAITEQVPDFSKAPPLRSLAKISKPSVDQSSWIERARSLSAIFSGFPQIRNSSIEFEAVQSVRYLVTSEGSEVRTPELLIFLRARASTHSPDGMTVRDAVVFHALDFARMPVDSELKQGITSLAQNVTTLAGAPKGENYTGPVLFEGIAAGQLFAEVLGKNLVMIRRPVMEPGRPGAFPESDLEGRLGSRVLPEWMSVVDDPTQAEWRGKRLFGHYTVDREGVAPQRLNLVEKGILKNFLLTRQPVRGFAQTNGRARMPGNFGANTAGFSNLFVQASQTAPAAEMKKKMFAMLQARNKPFGIIVRKMDFPSSASFEEVRRLLMASAQSGSGSRPVSSPILVYRVYPDGREELVRGLRFRGLSVRSLKDIVAASDENHLFEFLDSPAPFALMGAGGFASETCVIAPSVLIDDLELHRVDEELPKPPIVPAPMLSALK